VLSVAAAKIAKKLSDDYLGRINKTSAVIIFYFGTFALFKTLIL